MGSRGDRQITKVVWVLIGFAWRGGVMPIGLQPIKGLFDVALLLFIHLVTWLPFLEPWLLFVWGDSDNALGRGFAWCLGVCYLPKGHNIEPQKTFCSKKCHIDGVNTQYTKFFFWAIQKDIGSNKCGHKKRELKNGGTNEELWPALVPSKATPKCIFNFLFGNRKRTVEKRRFASQSQQN